MTFFEKILTFWLKHIKYNKYICLYNIYKKGKERSFYMKKENGMTILNILLILVIAIIIVGVALAMVLEEPKDSTNMQNSINNTQNVISNSIDDTQNSLDTQNSESIVDTQNEE